MRYVYTPPPSDPASLPVYIAQQLQLIAQATTSATDLLTLDVSNKAPAKVRDGLIALADGTNWNPGSGKGFYGYYNSAWHFLG